MENVNVQNAAAITDQTTLGELLAMLDLSEKAGNEEGLFRDDLAWNRTVEKYGPIKGTFFVCGLGFEDFTGLTDEQIEKYKALFWEPEIFIPTPNGMVVLHIVD